MGEVRVQVELTNAGDEALVKGRVEYANGYEETVDHTEPVVIAIDGRRVTEEPLVLGSEVLIDQTVLELMDFLVDPANQRVIRNPAHPDQPVLKVK